MTPAGPFGRWDRLRPLDTLGVLWSVAAAVPPVPQAAVLAHHALFATARRLLIGRRVTLCLDDRDLRLTVTGIEARSANLAVGRVGEVRVSAADICWAGGTFTVGSAVLHDVVLRPGMPPEVLAAPVELTAVLATDALDGLLRGVSPPSALTGDIDEHGVARLRWARRPAWGGVEVDAELDGPMLCLRARGVTVGRRRLPLPPRAPAYRVPLPELPHGLRLTGVGFSPGLLELTGVLPRWRATLPGRGG
ncbi:hypothetical protein LV457_12830 [Mycobacterium sp. MYCO198283]|uniref:hypothetical protein n=1 Tax=Mycobacterium sp. MYCO198283 TaxID=2883505 RepID=UPI001E45294F|nr:hypothetical protein [Mycobacterium sp. MYCO198283]MCG5433161.1 hypothetical protein [Mycobacterium sp. MYCO198283]